MTDREEMDTTPNAHSNLDKLEVRCFSQIDVSQRYFPYPDTSVSGKIIAAIADIRFITALTSVAAADTSMETLAKYVD